MRSKLGQVEVRAGKHHKNADFLSDWKVNPGWNHYLMIFQTSTYGIWRGKLLSTLTLFICSSRRVFPPGLSVEEKIVFLHKVGPYTIIKGVLFKILPNQKLHCCLKTREIS